MEPTRTTDARRWFGLALLCSAFFMVILDVAIVNVALPSIQADLDFSQNNLQWVVSAYALTFGGLLLLGGRAADLLGRRRVFVAGVAVFALASLLGGLAPSAALLIAARALQGIGAAAMTPAALSILMTTFREGAERNKALGAWGAVGASGGTIGLLIGGVLTETVGWEWIFLLNVPVGAVVIALSPVLLDETRAFGVARRFDLAGAATVTAALSLLVYALVDAGTAGWSLATDDRPRCRLGAPARSVRRDRTPLGRAAGAVPDLPAPRAARLERRRGSLRRGGLRDVLHHHALPAAGPRLLAAQGRLRLAGPVGDGARHRRSAAPNW